MGQDEAALTLVEGTTLAHALMAEIAAASGIRLLSIKGPAADHHELRPPRVAADADVLVDPSDFDRFLGLMVERGWHERVERTVPSFLGPHSVTMINERWPNDIDVHFWFPGFFADRAVVFDALWRGRVAIPVAHRIAQATSRPDTAVILCLHALRYTRSARHEKELAHVVDVMKRTFSEAELERVAEIARIGRAQTVLETVLRQLELDYRSDLTADEIAAWDANRHTIESGSAVAWLSEIKNASWSRKPGLFLRAMWISREDIPRNDPAVIPTRRMAWAHRWSRWCRGALALVHLRRFSITQRK
ncbi:nucleotidyltransferase family protein [Microbacterium mangrovi]|uniref:nucleotidyltransferase family protein n=1 Tax=Microbacterium mangrovi TaxID=1348253 RepID=UPI00068AC0B3|nr:nucleotidyltransferase family protein [Microbacterium mangrovi]